MLVAVAFEIAKLPNTHYYPIAHGHAAGTVRGVLIAFDAGMASGTLALRDSRGRVSEYSIGAGFRIDGVLIDCAHAGAPRATRAITDCPRWPASVRIGSTIVYGHTYRSRRYGHADTFVPSLTSHPDARIPSPS